MNSVVDEQSAEASTAPRSRTFWAFRLEPWLLVVLFVAFALLARLFPLSGDDWAWGSAEGMDRLENRFDGYNGRWAGNFAILFLSRAPLVAPLAVAATLCVFLFLLTRISGLKNVPGYAVALALVMLMPLGTWRQGVVWLSGFANYALGTIGLLLFIHMTARVLRSQSYRSPALVAAVSVPVALVSAMFIEHVTVALVLFSIVALVVAVVKRRQWIVSAAWALGAVIGAGIMFSNASYRNVASGTSTYHKVDDSGFGVMMEHAMGGVSHLSVAINLGLNAVVVAAIGLLVWRTHQQTGRVAVAPVLTLGLALVALMAGTGVDALGSEVIDWAWVSAVALAAALGLAAFVLVTDVERRVTLLALMALFVVLVAPAAALRPYGPRNFMPTYIVMVAIVLLLVREFMDAEARAEVKAVVTAVALATAAVVFSGYLAVFTHVHNVDEMRLAKIERAVEKGKTKVRVPKLPHADHVHHSDPPNDVYVSRFKRFHGFPEDLKIRFVD